MRASCTTGLRNRGRFPDPNGCLPKIDKSRRPGDCETFRKAWKAALALGM